jgi:hypothetical protein
MVFKNFLKFFVNNRNNVEDLAPLTEFLKKNSFFKNAALKIHYTKEGVKNKVYDSMEGLLKDEDGLKFIEDDKNKNKNTNKK